MRNDDFQVLGVERKKRLRYRWMIVTLAVIAIGIAIGLGVYWATAPQTVKTGKKMGDPTILPDLQAVASSLLNAELTEIGGQQGQVIVMEVHTGEILAMVGLERNFEGKYQPCQNFGYQQELGSLMKTASVLAAFETGKVKLSDTFDTGGGIWPVDNERQMKDHNWHRGGYGMLTLDRALAVSSNIGIGKAVMEAFGNNQQGFFDQLDKMSFGQPENIEGIDRLKPTIFTSPKDSNWINSRLWWSAIGYERKMAPIQMLTFYNAIANGGRMVKPTLKTGIVEIINPQIASKANIDSMQVALEHVVSEGLGMKAGTPLVMVAGKTGTSQVGEYDFGDENYVSEYQLAFCGYFPADAPKYSMIVSMNKLGLPASGGGMAGPIFRQIVEYMMGRKLPNAM